MRNVLFVSSLFNMSEYFVKNKKTKIKSGDWHHTFTDQIN